MNKRETYRANAEARADVAARPPRPAGDTATIRYLTAAAYREADRTREPGDGEADQPQEVTHEQPTAAGEAGPRHR
jgi:hypothetical protein